MWVLLFMMNADVNLLGARSIEKVALSSNFRFESNNLIIISSSEAIEHNDL